MMNNSWLLFALGSAFFAALTAVLGKLGVAEINSNLATFIRTLIIVVLTAGIVTARSEWQPLGRLPGYGVMMLTGSAIATGLSWLCYYRALQLGPASKVAPVDKLSVALVLLMSVLFLGETLTWKLLLGSVMIITGVILVTLS